MGLLGGFVGNAYALHWQYWACLVLALIIIATS